MSNYVPVTHAGCCNDRVSGKIISDECWDEVAKALTITQSIPKAARICKVHHSIIYYYMIRGRIIKVGNEYIYIGKHKATIGPVSDEPEWQGFIAITIQL